MNTKPQVEESKMNVFEVNIPYAVGFKIKNMLMHELKNNKEFLLELKNGIKNEADKKEYEELASLHQKLLHVYHQVAEHINSEEIAATL